MSYRSFLPKDFDIEEIPFIYAEETLTAQTVGARLTDSEVVAISIVLNQMLEEAAPVRDSWAQSARVSLLR